MRNVREQAQEHLKVGREIGDRYLLIRPLGRGPLWQTWWAEDCRDGGRLVLRVLDAVAAGRNSRRNWLRNGLETLADLPQDGELLTPVWEDTGGDEALIIQRGLPGENLAQQLAAGGDAVPEGEEASRILHTLSRALFRLHKAGLAHGNLHAAQVILTGDECRCALSDALISRYCWAMVTKTRGLNTAKHGFVPVEDLPRKPEPGDDVLALSHLVYRWLTGTTPSAGDEYESVAVRRASLQPRLMAVTEEWSEVIDNVLTHRGGSRRLASEDFFAQLNEVSGWEDDEFFRGNTEASRPEPEVFGAEFRDPEDDALQYVTEEEDGGPLEVIHASMNPNWKLGRKPAEELTDRPGQPLSPLGRMAGGRLETARAILERHWPLATGAILLVLMVVLALWLF